MRFLAGGRGHTYCSETCEEQSKKSSGKMAGRRSNAQISSPYCKKLIGAAIVHAGPSVEKRESWKTMKPAALPGACRDMRSCSIHSSGCLVSLRHKKDKTATSKIQSNRNFSLPSASSIQVGRPMQTTQPGSTNDAQCEILRDYADAFCRTQLHLLWP